MRPFQRSHRLPQRQRLLHLTEAGEELRQRLMAPQIARIRRALMQSSKEACHQYRTILYHLVSPENRESVRDWIGKASIIGGDREGRG